MVLYAIFPAALASALFLIFHYGIAAFGTYAFSKVLGVHWAGAAFAAIAYVSSNWFYRMSVCCPAYIQVASWLPLSFLGIELAIATESLHRRIVFGSVAALAFSQILGAWLGKGSLYAVLVLGAYLFYRTMVFPTVMRMPLRQRIIGFVATGAIFTVWTSLLSAGGILPRYEYRSLSNLADGYQGFQANTGGWASEQFGGRLFGTGGYSPGNVVMVLAIVGAIVAGLRYAAPFFLATIAACLLLILRRQTPFHELAYLIPQFKQIHLHFPEQIMMVVQLPLAMLAGICISSFIRAPRERSLVDVALIAPFLVIAGLGAPIRDMPWQIVFAVLAAVLLLRLMLSVHMFNARVPIAIAIVMLHLASFFSIASTIANNTGPVMRTDLETYFQPTSAVEFLEHQADRTGVPFRYFGYDPHIGRNSQGFWVPYRYDYAEQDTMALVVNNRATVFKLYDIQGQNNPVQLSKYVRYLQALNGQPQDYHESVIFDTGLQSPLLDMLNVRYIVLPAQFPDDRTDLRSITRQYATVYQDEDVQIVERHRALPRAWIVHSVRSAPADDAISVLATGSTDPSTDAFVDGPAPDIDNAADPHADQAVIRSYAPEHIQVETITDARGLLILSEVAYPGWRVSIDGQPAKLYTANGLFRAVVIPIGTHTVEFTFQSRSLQIGAIISGGTYAATVGFYLWHLARQSLRRLGWTERSSVVTKRHRVHRISVERG